MKPHSYNQSHSRFEDPAVHKRSHDLATLMVGDALRRNVCLEDVVRHALPRLSIFRLERVMTLIRNILTSKRATQARYADDQRTTEWEVTPSEI